MALAQKAYLFPIRFATANPVIRIHPDSGGIGSAQDVTLTVAVNTSYYLSGDGSATDLVTILETALDSNTDGETYTVSLTGATQTITITADSASVFQILWSHANTTVAAEIFGWDSATDLTGANAYTAPSATQGAWLPLQPMRRDTGDESEVVGEAVVTGSGSAHGSSSGDTVYHRDITYDLLDPSVVKIADAVATGLYNTLERAWVTEAFGRGAPVRVYDDATSRTTSSFTAYTARRFTRPWRDQFDDLRVRLYEVRLELVRSG